MSKEINDKYGKMFWKIAHDISKGSMGYDAEDLIGEIWIHILQHQNDYSYFLANGEKESTFYFRIAKNKALDVVRKELRRNKLIKKVPLRKATVDPEVTANFWVEEVQQKLKRRMPKKTSEVVSLFLSCNGNYERAAKKYGTTIRVVKRHVLRARKEKIFSGII